MALFLLEGEEKIIAEEKAHLLEDEFLLAVEVNHFADDEDVLLIRLDLGPLRGVEHVLEGKWMQAESPAELSQEIEVAESVDVDPVDLRRVVAIHQLLEGVELRLED